MVYFSFSDMDKIRLNPKKYQTRQELFGGYTKEEVKKAKEVLAGYGKCDICMKFKKEERLSERVSKRGYEWYICDKHMKTCEGCGECYIPCDKYVHAECKEDACDLLAKKEKELFPLNNPEVL